MGCHLELILTEVSNPSKFRSFIVTKPNPTFAFLRQEVMKNFEQELRERYPAEQISMMRPIFKTETGYMIMDEAKYFLFVKDLNHSYNQKRDGSKTTIKFFVELIQTDSYETP